MPDLITDARQLASGTIASLTGHKDYATIARIQAEFVEYVEETGHRYETWAAAWRDYWKLQTAFTEEP